MSINLNNFVNINIDYQKSLELSATRETVAILDDKNSTSEGAGSIDLGNYYITKESDEYKIINDGGTEKGFDTLPTSVQNMVELFFNLGGKKIRYIKYNGINEGTTYPQTIQAIKDLDSDIICIASTFGITTKSISSSSETISKSKLQQVSEYIDSNKSDLSGINEKMFFGSYSCGNDVTDYTYTETQSESFILKCGQEGIEMSILAYLSKLNIEKEGVQDYCYTEENKVKTSVFRRQGSTSITYENSILDSDKNFKELKKSNINCDINLLNSIRAFGGNMINGYDLVNNFVKIILTQELTKRLAELLTKKIRYNSNSINLISATITSELNKYKDYGYLSTDKTYVGDDIKDGDYVILKNNSKLNLGYKISILPISSLTPDQIRDHSMPTIYLILADSYAIRMIEITGTIIKYKEAE